MADRRPRLDVPALVRVAVKRDKRKIMTPKFLIATQDNNRFFSFSEALKALIDADIHWADSGKDALIRAGSIIPLLVVIDEILPDMTGMELGRELLNVNALINTALVSRLSPHDFHEVSEGLGILVQLPESPGEKEALNTILALKSIFAL